MAYGDPIPTVTFRDTLLAMVPRWMRGGSIGKLVYTLGVMLDAVGDALFAGMRRRAPELASEDAGALIAADRRIIRGRTEPWAVYAKRIRTWRQSHRIRGNPYALLRQLHAYWQGTLAISLLYNGTSKMRFDLAPDGTITRSETSVAFPGGPSRWLLVYWWPDPLAPPIKWGAAGVEWGDGHVWGSGLTPEEVSDVRRVPKGWGNAHSRGRLRLTYTEDVSNYVELSLD